MFVLGLICLAVLASSEVIYDDIYKQNISSVIYQVSENGTRQISYEDYRTQVLNGIRHAKLIESKTKNMVHAGNKKDNTTELALYFCYVTGYNQQESTTWLDSSKNRVTSNTNCDAATCSITKTNSISYSESFQVGIGINLSSGDKSTIASDASLSYTWQKSWTNSETYSMTINNGDNAYMVFQSEMQDTLGTAHQKCRGEHGVPVNSPDFHVYASSSAGFGTYSLIYDNHGSGGSGGGSGGGSCSGGRPGQGNGNGGPGACCQTNDDCKDTCNFGMCGDGNGNPSGGHHITPGGSCSGGRPGQGDGSGDNGACCKGSDDCKDTCTNGVCGAAP